jgi:UDP-N-acetylglucosamine 2-epimerase (non-hydrolysing)
VIDHHERKIVSSRALENLEIDEGKFFLATMHRAENVDIERRLRGFVQAMILLHQEYGYPVICSFHPRTRAKVQAFGVDVNIAGLRFVEPFGFFDFIKLEKAAFCLLSDSGTVQEEACLFGVPNVTIRDVTERPETVECGSNVLSGADPQTILSLVKMVVGRKGAWQPPEEYLAEGVADKVCRIMLSYRVPDPAQKEWQAARKV